MALSHQPHVLASDNVFSGVAHGALLDPRGIDRSELVATGGLRTSIGAG